MPELYLDVHACMDGVRALVLTVGSKHLFATHDVRVRHYFGRAGRAIVSYCDQLPELFFFCVF